MEFHVETEYNQKTLAVMARAVRKTLSKKRSIVTYVFGWFLVALLLLMLIPLDGEGFVLDATTVINFVALIVLVVTLMFEDQLSGYFSRKRMPKGMEKAEVTFTEEDFVSVTGVGETRWNYSAIVAMAETRGYLVFMLNRNFGHAYDLSQLRGGTAEEFRTFLQEKTGKTVQVVK